MLEAIDKIIQFNLNRRINMFKDGISFPGLVLKYMFQDLPDDFPTITKTRSQVDGDVEKLQLLCLDTHEIVVLFHGILDLVTVQQSSKKIHLHGIHVIFPRMR
jgi:hypothetical protein